MYKLQKVNFEKGGCAYKLNDEATEMIIIQSGSVDIMHTVEGEPFAIERLYRGSIMNHHSFLLNDENDTNAKCVTTVSAFILKFEDLTLIRQKNAELDNEIKKVESKLLGQLNPIALDYIIKLPKDKKKVRNFELDIRRNALTVKLKNAIMQQWLRVKEIRKKPSIKDIL